MGITSKDSKYPNRATIFDRAGIKKWLRNQLNKYYKSLQRMNKERSTRLSTQQANLAMSFFGTAYEDYIAARQLLVNNLLIQGCILANTSIEKYFKGMKAILNEPIPRHHDITVKKFKNTLQNKFSQIHDLINFEFIELLSKSYKLRYHDEVETGFNITIIRTKTLAELDGFVEQIENRFRFTNKKLGETQSKYSFHKESKNPLLWQHNYSLNNFDKKDFIEKRDFVYEFRKVHEYNTLEFNYWTDEILNDGKFIYEAIKPNSEPSGTSFKLCFLPLDSNTMTGL